MKKIVFSTLYVHVCAGVPLLDIVWCYMDFLESRICCPLSQLFCTFHRTCTALTSDMRSLEDFGCVNHSLLTPTKTMSQRQNSIGSPLSILGTILQELNRAHALRHCPGYCPTMFQSVRALSMTSTLVFLLLTMSSIIMVVTGFLWLGLVSHQRTSCSTFLIQKYHLP